MSLRMISRHGRACALAIDGGLTIAEAAGLKADIDDVVAAASELEIDLSGVTEVDTAGLQLMLMAKRIDGARVRFVKHSDAVLQLLEWSNLAHALGDPLVVPAARTGRGTEARP